MDGVWLSEIEFKIGIVSDDDDDRSVIEITVTITITSVSIAEDWFIGLPAVDKPLGCTCDSNWSVYECQVWWNPTKSY